jgi:hypothetical protein
MPVQALEMLPGGIRRYEHLPLSKAGAGNSEWDADDFPENVGYH